MFEILDQPLLLQLPSAEGAAPLPQQAGHGQPQHPAQSLPLAGGGGPHQQPLAVPVLPGLAVQLDPLPAQLSAEAGGVPPALLPDS